MLMGKLENQDVIKEINDLQLDMQRWLHGDPNQRFETITERQAIDLTVINSKGLYETKDEFNTRYRTIQGKYPDIRLTAEVLRTKRLAQDRLLVTYLQTREYKEEKEKRVTTAVFSYDQTMKNNARWQHVHVTRVIETVH